MDFLFFDLIELVFDNDEPEMDQSLPDRYLETWDLA